MTGNNLHAPKNNRGFTLVEIMITMIVFSSVMITVGWVYNTGQKMMQTESEKRVAIELARQMMDEIMTREMSDPDVGQENGPRQCWECDSANRLPGEKLSRALFDDIDDYNGWDEGFFQHLETIDGTPMDGRLDITGNPTPDYSQPDRLIGGAHGYSIFRRQVSVFNVTPLPNGSFGLSPGVDTGFLQVTVMVSSLRDYNVDQDELQPGFSPVVLTRVISHSYR